MGKPPSPLRVLSWNILEGWHHRCKSGQPPQWDEDRLHAAQSLVKQINPDIVVLNEALWCRSFKDYEVDYAALLGFEHMFCDTYDGAWGNAVLSRLPFVDTHRFRIHNRGGLRVSVQSDDWTLGVATYHPHPSRYPQNKASDYRQLVPMDFEHPLVVCGDFNAISPADDVDQRALVEAFKRFSSRPEEDVARFVEGGKEVFGALEQLGLHDAMQPDWRKPTMPTDLLSKDKSSAMRIDHAWVNDRVRVVHGEVIVSNEANVASDHYPIVLDVLPGAAPA